ncbi:MAG: hypothetical protein F4245_04230 [Cenarchaeum sp. SB0678_bin_8]|nr:hypothetical protein [Cenarchaeum sp. SB0678_bin_8]
MKIRGWLDAIGLAFTIAGGIICAMHIQHTSGQTFAISCLLLGAFWLIFAIQHGLPVRIYAASRTAGTNGTILFSLILAATVVAVGVAILKQNPEWWFYVGASALFIASVRLLKLYWYLRKYGAVYAG